LLVKNGGTDLVAIVGHDKRLGKAEVIVLDAQISD